jgi:DNA repair protein RAD50
VHVLLSDSSIAEQNYAVDCVSFPDGFYCCRDKALQNFHTLKIREINKIIRELWQLIYKGQDIDSIEIESGQEEGAAATKSSRSYNYRVVMRKGT